METLNKISDGINKVCGWFLVLCFSVMTVAYFAQIVLRYAFGTGLTWTEEITRYSNVAMVMIGSAVMARTNSHINVSILQTIVSPKIRKWVIIIQQLITVIFSAAVVKIAFDMMNLAGTQVSTNLRVPMAVVYGVFPVAFAILAFQAIVFILNSIMDKEGE